MAAPLELRPATVEDGDFLFGLFASDRRSQFELARMPEDVVDGYLRMQFSARNASYAVRFPAADHTIVERGGVPVGRMIVDRSGDPMVLVDVALTKEHRGAGIGTRLVQDLVDEARRRSVAVSLHVEATARARRLYERKGFRLVEERGFHARMEWRPS